MLQAMRLTALAFLTTIHYVSASVGVLDIDDLLQPDLENGLFAPSETHPYAPWSHKPQCATSSYLATLGQKYCVYTSNSTGPHGLSIIFPPDSAREAARYLDDNPLDSFLTQQEAEALFIGDGPPWTVVDIPGKDKGVVATRKIKQYETFMIDQAAVVMDMEMEKALSDRESKRLLKVAVDRLLVPGMVRDMSSAHEGNKKKSSSGDQEPKQEEDGTLEDDIMRTNAYGGTVADVSSRALYPLISVCCMSAMELIMLNVDLCSVSTMRVTPTPSSCSLGPGSPWRSRLTATLNLARR